MIKITERVLDRAGDQGEDDDSPDQNAEGDADLTSGMMAEALGLVHPWLDLAGPKPHIRSFRRLHVSRPRGMQALRGVGSAQRSSAPGRQARLDPACANPDPSERDRW
jgi:hypothetical protein